ncbi:hypothetical protein AGMMS49587_14270 [Spirochaetia bacterium]|nr:hypothetical protein AGMMS49587_14270 [Spirochaetia bacterium]
MEIKLLEAALEIFEQTQKKIRNAELAPEKKEELKSELNTLIEKTGRIQDLKEGAPYRIGVIGHENQGKSFLLNTLLGIDISPEGNEPTTPCAIEIIPADKEGFNLTLTKNGETTDDSFCNLTAEGAQKKIEECMKNCKNIKVEGKLSNPVILKDGLDIIYVDTPGVVSKDSSIKDQRALAILNNVDIILFCVRLEYLGTAKYWEFYKTYLKNKDVINTITQSDAWKDDELKEHEIKLSFQADYECKNFEDIVIISAKNTKEQIQAAYQDDQSAKWTDEMLNHGNMRALKQRLLFHADQIDLIHKLENLFCIYHEKIKDYQEQLLPKKEYLKKFLDSLEDENTLMKGFIEGYIEFIKSHENKEPPPYGVDPYPDFFGPSIDDFEKSKQEFDESNEETCKGVDEFHEVVIKLRQRRNIRNSFSSEGGK